MLRPASVNTTQKCALSYWSHTAHEYFHLQMCKSAASQLREQVKRFLFCLFLSHSFKNIFCFYLHTVSGDVFICLQQKCTVFLSGFARFLFDPAGEIADSSSCINICCQFYCTVVKPDFIWVYVNCGGFQTVTSYKRAVLSCRNKCRW